MVPRPLGSQVQEFSVYMAAKMSLKDSGMIARTAAGEKEKRSIGQLQQVDKDDDVEYDDVNSLRMMISRRRWSLLLSMSIRVQLVLGKRGSAETHLPGGYMLYYSADLL